MKCAASLAISVVLCAAAVAQNVPNPVTTAARADLERQSRNLIAAAEEMPAGKYNYQPTPQQMTYGKLIAHVAQSNVFLCSTLAGIQAPKPMVSEKDSKDTIVSALKNSFDTCSAALGKLDDSVLGDRVMLFGGRNSTKAGALLALVGDWADHYSAAAMYLRLNGMLPPTAKAKEE